LLYEDYLKAVDTALSLHERVAAFNRRALWGLAGADLDVMNRMVTVFSRLGLVERQPGAHDTDRLPPVMYVERTRTLPRDVVPTRNFTISDFDEPA
jgi:hypothetical protein